MIQLYRHDLIDEHEDDDDDVFLFVRYYGLSGNMVMMVTDDDNGKVWFLCVLGKVLALSQSGLFGNSNGPTHLTVPL